MGNEALPKGLSRVIFTAEALQRRVRELAKEIEHDYKVLLGDRVWERPPVAVGLLRGAVVFPPDLVRAMEIPIEYDFISISSYGDRTFPGELKLIKDLEVSLEGRDVLIVEDIIDTGRTLDYIRKLLLQRRPRSLRICCLIDKVPRREVEVEIDYLGFRLEEDEFLVGYGLDYAGLYRNLPYVAALKPEALKGV